MKKIYTITFLTTIIFTTSCMEKQRPRKRSTCEEEAQFPSVSPSSIIPIYIHGIHQVMPNFTPINHNGYQNIPVCEADQPGWQDLHRIANTTYTYQQQDNQQEIELTPIYRTAKLNTNNTVTTTTQQNTHLMEQTYNNAYTFVDYERTTKEPNLATEHKNLSMLIRSMNSAKNHGITEDDMGKFAYKTYDHDTTSRYIPLLFCCLKRYNLTVKETNENIPVHISAFDENLIRIFGIEDKSNTCAYVSNTDQINAFLTSYPAYNNLLSKLKLLIATIINNNPLNIPNALSSYLYASEKILSQHYSDGSYIDLHNEFYHKTYNLLIHNGHYKDLDNLLIMIYKAKQLGAIQKETDLGRAILNFDPTKIIMGEIINFWNKKYGAIDTKNRISLFCNLVEKYNNTNPHKQRPASLHWGCYSKQKKLDLALPDSCTLFDTNKYALNEFEQFKENVIKLMKSDDQSVQLCVNRVYYEKS